MIPKHVREALGVLSAAYPREAVSSETANVYSVKLGPVPARRLHAAVSRLIETSRFFPTIAEVLTVCEALRLSDHAEQRDRERRRQLEAPRNENPPKLLDLLEAEKAKRSGKNRPVKPSFDLKPNKIAPESEAS